MTGNFRGSMASYYFVIKHSRLLMMDLRIMPVMKIIRNKTFAEVQKTAKTAKVSCHESLGMRTLCWNNFGNNRMQKESGIMLE